MKNYKWYVTIFTPDGDGMGAFTTSGELTAGWDDVYFFETKGDATSYWYRRKSEFDPHTKVIIAKALNT